MAGWKETLRATARQGGRPLRFGVVGASGVLVNTLVLVALAQHARLPLWLAGALATEAAVVSNFVLNDRWTFGACGNRSERAAGLSAALRRFARYNGVALGGIVLGAALLMLLTNVGGLALLAANLVAVAVSAGWNYFASSRWAWGLPRHPEGEVWRGEAPPKDLKRVFSGAGCPLGLPQTSPGDADCVSPVKGRRRCEHW
jgi:putative flippase GtrA